MQIYRAFLATSTLMLVVSAVLDHYGIDAPNLALDDVSVMLASPLTGAAELLTFQRQPYLASVLPMYVLFALASPVLVPFARRHPWLLVALSIASWLTAGWLGPELLDADGFRWSFNPFAWQLMFVAGVLARCQPFYRRIALGRWGPPRPPHARSCSAARATSCSRGCRCRKACSSAISRCRVS